MGIVLRSCIDELIPFMVFVVLIFMIEGAFVGGCVIVSRYAQSDPLNMLLTAVLVKMTIDTLN
jgi:glutaredoxin-related protein